MDKLKHVRAGHRAHVKRLFSEINNDIDSVKRNGLKEALIDKQKILKELNDKILGLLPEVENELMNEIEESGKISDQIFHHLSLLQSMDCEDGSDSGSTVSNEKPRSPPSQLKVKLPKIEIRKFSGKKLQWRGFWEQFYSSIHSNEQLDDIEKFTYLRSLLEGKALKCIEGLSLSTNNYAEALHILQERFGNKQSLIAAHMEDLRSIKKIESLKQVKELRSMYDKLEMNIRNLKDLEVETCTYGPLLIAIISERIPKELFIIISRSLNDEDWNLTEFLRLFKTELQAQERCNDVVSSLEKDDLDITSTTQNLHVETFSKNHPLTKRDNPISGKNVCVFCKEKHVSNRCKNVTDVNTRQDIIKRENRCFICLKKGHKARKCRIDYECFRCKGKHNISLCDLEDKAAGSSGKQAVPSIVNQQTHQCDGEQNIILQSAKSIVSDSGNNLNTFTRILFDGCSHRTYITDSLRRRLQLKTVRTETLIIKRFASDEGALKTLDVVQICVKGSSPNVLIYMEALVVPHICSPLSNPELNFVQSRYPYLKGLILAENLISNRVDDIEILVGIDYYYAIISGRTARGPPNGPVAIESILGWIICGPTDIKVNKRGVTNVNLINSLNVRNKKLENDDLKNELHKFWEIENCGFEETEDVYSKFKDEISFDGERYVCKLPFKPNADFLSDIEKV